ncbi:MAG: hypothetical protein HIU84_05365 [Acidobacteria bacterium]|nr:hypothetical protein [Acidobacteriota bacterium]
MIDPRFIYLAALVSFAGTYGYIRDTVRGVTSPNRVTWGLWAIEGLLAFVVEIQQHVGLASLTTLMLGLMPMVIVVVSFKNPHSVWKIGRFDLFCGVISLSGLIFWGLVNAPTVALISFIAADQIAALPTVRKAWIAPATESSRVFFLGVVNCAITLMTLKHFTTAGVLFPGCILVTDLVIGLLVVTRLGQRLGGTASQSLRSAT